MRCQQPTAGAHLLLKSGSGSDVGADAGSRQLDAIVRDLGGYAASHVEGTGAAPGALCYPALDTVGCRDRPCIGAVCPFVRDLGGYAASHVEGTGAAPGALCYPALDTVGRRDRPCIGAVCPFVRLVSGVSEHIIGDRPRPDPVWETARFSVPPASHGCPSSVSCDWRLP